jgi:DNA repair protein RadD
VIELRPYQLRAVEWILRIAAKRPNARLMIVLPTGGGKSAIAAALLRLMVARQKQTRGLFVAHRAELLGQARATMTASGVDPVIVADLESQAEGSRIVLAGSQALALAEEASLPKADVLVTDEAHRDAGPFRRRLRALYGDALRIGFTATPERLDGRALREDFDDMLVAAQPSELIADGHIVAPRVFTVPAERLPDLREVRTRDGEFDAAETARRANVPALLGDVVEHWIRRAERRRTLVFATSKAHSAALAERFKKAGVPAAHLDGDENPTRRAALLDDLARGVLDVLTSCDLLNEGIDIPAIKCVVMARPTASLLVCNQQAGRCMRPWKDQSALILDHAGNIVRHGYPHADREWSLDGIRERGSSTKNKVIACPRCHAVVPPGVRCPSCGSSAPTASSTPATTERRPKEILPAELPGELATLGAAIPLRDRLAEYNRLRDFAGERGFDLAWADKVYRAKYGESRPG